jgi:hypothetical protein
MSLLRELFGPSKEEVWRQLSAESDAQYIEGGFWKGDKVQAQHAEWTVTLDTYVISNGKSSIPFTRMRAPFKNPEAFRFTIYRHGFFSEMAKWFGMQDVAVGYATFDDNFIIKGSDEAKLRRLFANARIRALIEAQPEIHFTLKHPEVYFGGKDSVDVDVLEFVVAGVIKDITRLKLLYELFAETLDELCRIRAVTGK